MRYRVNGSGEVDKKNDLPITDDKRKKPICLRVACGKFEPPTEGYKRPLEVIHGRPKRPPLSWFKLQRRYEQCTAMDCLPKVGGFNNQDWFEMRLFSSMREAEKQAKDQQRLTMFGKMGKLGAIAAIMDGK